MDYNQTFDNKKENNDDEIAQFLEKMLPLIENTTTQAGDVDLSEQKKQVIETKGGLEFPKKIIESYPNIKNPKILGIFIRNFRYLQFEGRAK